MENRPENGILEEFRLEFQDCWRKLPNKGFFLLLLAGWVGLFHFVGNPTLGYVKSASLFRWMLDAYSPTGDYLSGEEAYAVIMPFVVLGLFWWKRKELVNLSTRLWAPALLLVGFALLLHLAAFTVQQPKASVIALFVGIYGLMGLAWGLDWLRASFFPFFLLGFCMPIGDQAQLITVPLQHAVAGTVAAIAHLGLSPDLIRRGTQLLSGSGTFNFDVAPACSGIRSLFSLAAFNCVYAFVWFRTGWKRALLLVAAIPLAILGNVVRICFTVGVAEVLGQDAGKTVEQNFGLVTFAVAIGLVMLLGHWLSKGEPGTSSSQENPAGIDGPGSWTMADESSVK